MVTRPSPETHQIQRQVAPVLVGVGFGAVRSIVWLAKTTVPVEERLLAAGVELAHWFIVGLYFGVVLALVDGFVRGDGRGARALRLGVGFLACLLVLGSPIGGDLSGFAARQEHLPPLAVVALGGALAPLLLVLVMLVARKARRFEFALGLAFIAAVLVMGGEFVLRHDYPGVHLFIALVAGALAIPLALHARLSERAHPFAWGGTALVALTWLAMGTPPSVGPLIVNDTGAAVSPRVEQVRHAVSTRWLSPETETRATGQWLSSRAKLPPRPPRPSPVERPVVLLISIDALRSPVITDGHHDELLPTFAALRQRSAVFTHARSPATLTKISMASLFRGNYFSQQYWTPRRAELFTPARDETVTFPQLLQKAKVDTWNVRTIAWLKNGPLFRGFDEQPYAQGSGKGRYATADAALPELMRAVDAIGEDPTFVFTHLSDPHAPYAHGGKKHTEFQKYLREIEFVDRHLEKFFAHVEARGLTDRTFVIVTADHGEEFGEHGAETHGTTLYEAALRVPLFISGPGIEHRVIDENVTTLDLGPTILDLFGVPTPGPVMGESLLGAVLGEKPHFTRPIAAETRLLRAWVTPDDLKIVWDTRTGRVEAYDLRNDPGEMKNLFGRSPAAERAFADLQAFFAVHRFKKKGYEPPFFR